MKSKLTLLFSVFIIGLSQAQEVPRKIVVEHFTNSRCSTCASRNPGFYANYLMQNKGNMMHLAIHPSSPYATCVFNKHDVAANDGRTRYYQVYGSTPKLVINGKLVSSSVSFTSPSIFTPYLGLTSPIKLEMSQQKFGNDSIRLRVVIKTVATHSLATQNLYLVLAEDTIFYNAPNGENEHYDVFRRSLSGNAGMNVTVSPTVGDSVVITRTTATHSAWDFNRIYGMAILEDANTKEVTQSERLNASDNMSVVTGITNVQTNVSVRIFPNPVTNKLTIQTDYKGSSTYKIISLAGNVVLNGTFTNAEILDVSNLTHGVYFVQVSNQNGTQIQKMVKTE
tara:strand:+ start:47855 stop:48868 length:1014 start_codon:yes stop_codon:yes gene_type:complete